MTQASSDASRLDGEWAVVVGASLGIGRAIAEGLVAQGAHVVVAARNETRLAEAADDLRRGAPAGQQVVAMAADISDPESITALFDRIRNELPRLNICVANAGIGALTPFLDVSLEEWNSIVATNLTGTFLTCQQAARLMTENEPGANSSIVVISSIRATGARPGRLPYSATKAALNQLVRVAALELVEHNIRINALSPGITVTPLIHPDNPLVVEAISRVPMGRAASPSDMTAAALYLCGPGSSFVTGTNLVVDGGESLS